MVGVEEMLCLNQIAQGLRKKDEALSWFGSLGVEVQREVLEYSVEMAKQAGAAEFDVAEAVANSGLKKTFTPCVLLLKEPLRAQYSRLLSLPTNEWSKSLILLLSLFRIANQRRLEAHPENRERHWWNWDLADPAIVAKIHRLYNDGNL